MWYNGTMNSGIYQIMNKTNYHMYIGSAVDLRQRWKNHQNRLNTQTHHSIHLQNAWDKCGGDAFEFSVIEYVETDSLISKEQFYFDILKPEYNVCKIAGKRSWLGMKHSEETKRKQSLALRGRKRPPETIAKMRAANLGKMHSEETRQKMSLAAKGKPKSKEHCKSQVERWARWREINNP